MPSQEYSARLADLHTAIKENKSILPANKRLLLEFSRDMKLAGYSEARNHKLTTHIKRIAENFGKDFRSANREDVKQMLEWVQSQGFFPKPLRITKSHCTFSTNGLGMETLDRKRFLLR